MYALISVQLKAAIRTHYVSRADVQKLEKLYEEAMEKLQQRVERLEGSQSIPPGSAPAGPTGAELQRANSDTIRSARAQSSDSKQLSGLARAGRGTISMQPSRRRGTGSRHVPIDTTPRAAERSDRRLSQRPTHMPNDDMELGDARALLDSLIKRTNSSR